MQRQADHNVTLLAEELKRGNEKAFRRLYDLYRNDIYGYSISLLKNTDLAEENVQEVFLKFWLHRDTLDATKSVKSFLFTIARNQAFNLLNRAANESRLLESVFYESQSACADADYTIRQELCDNLQEQAMEKLPAGRKKIFSMSRNEGKSYEEISLELGISVSTVKTQMSKALESMRLFFRAHDEVLLFILHTGFFSGLYFL